MSAKCTICKQILSHDKFNMIKRSGEMILAKSCIQCNIDKMHEVDERQRLKYLHLWTRNDGSKISDPWEIVDDHQYHECNRCRDLCDVKAFALHGTKYNPRLSKACIECIEYSKEGVERRKRGEYKEEWVWYDIQCFRDKNGNMSYIRM